MGKWFQPNAGIATAPCTPDWLALEEEARAHGYFVKRARCEADVKRWGGRYAYLSRDEAILAANTPAALRRLLCLPERG